MGFSFVLVSLVALTSRVDLSIEDVIILNIPVQCRHDFFCVMKGVNGEIVHSVTKHT